VVQKWVRPIKNGVEVKEEIKLENIENMTENIDLTEFELIYEEEDLVLNKLNIRLDGFEKDFISIWAVGDSDVLISKSDIFHLIAYDKGHKRIASQGNFLYFFSTETTSLV